MFNHVIEIVYNAFSHFNQKDLKVVILGQDCYHGEDQANGLALDSSCLKDFENSTKSKNLFFSEGINFIQDFFKVKNILGEKQTNTLIKKFGKNNLINKFFIKTADEGIFNI